MVGFLVGFLVGILVSILVGFRVTSLSTSSWLPYSSIR
jgi:hypothetical protein